MLDDSRPAVRALRAFALALGLALVLVGIGLLGFGTAWFAGAAGAAAWDGDMGEALGVSIVGLGVLTVGTLVGGVARFGLPAVLLALGVLLLAAGAAGLGDARGMHDGVQFAASRGLGGDPDAAEIQAIASAVTGAAFVALLLSVACFAAFFAWIEGRIFRDRRARFLHAATTATPTWPPEDASTRRP